MIARIKEECVEEFAEILKNVKGTGREYKKKVEVKNNNGVSKTNNEQGRAA